MTAPTEPQRTRAGTVSWAAVGLGVVLGVALRLRMFFTPITSDEGGFLAIARAWANGKVLYRDVWVDRPQGLLVVYRVWDWISGGSVASLRIMAMLFGALMVWGVASVTTTLAGRRAGAIAAVLVGITSASPAIEGHIANGELLSGAVAVAGLAVGVRALTTGASARWFVLSGVIAGLALSIKQSGYEGVLTIVVWLFAAASVGWRDRRAAVRAGLLIVAGIAGVVVVLALHGALTGFSRWWFAFGGYRFSSRSALTGADWPRFRLTARIALPTIGPLLLGCAYGVVAGRSKGPSRRLVLPWLMPIWGIVAVLAFATGGQFHRHYWVTLCPAFSALAAVGVERLTRERRATFAVAATAVLAIAPLVNSISILRLNRSEATQTASDDYRLIQEEHLATWFHSHRDPGDVMYLMCAGASFYANADEDPPYPYLWFDNIQMVPGALAKLRYFISSPRTAPRFIALQQPGANCDESGVVEQQLRDHYTVVATVDGVQVVARSSGS